MLSADAQHVSAGRLGAALAVHAPANSWRLFLNISASGRRNRRPSEAGCAARSSKTFDWVCARLSGALTHPIWPPMCMAAEPRMALVTSIQLLRHLLPVIPTICLVHVQDVLCHLPAHTPRDLPERGPLLHALGLQVVVVDEELEEQHEVARVHAQAKHRIRLVHVALVPPTLVLPCLLRQELAHQ